MGTAGHVDHGKTSLIKALTGIDGDTHKEEKKRGITINLGFSHLDLDDKISLGIVDVPGHKDFVKTMIAGAHGIDFVLNEYDYWQIQPLVELMNVYHPQCLFLL